MPANLTPQYLEAEERFRKGSSDEERLAALEDMYALLPKHKGTDKIQADIRRRISRIKKKSERPSRVSRETPYRVIREGAGQVILVGPPNTGKSSVASLLSGVALRSAPYPFTTQLPQVAMMSYLDVQVQLVDLPPVTADFCTYWQINLCRSGDLILLIIDLGRKNVFSELDQLLRELKKRRIELAPPPPEPEEGVMYKRFILLGNKIDLESARANREVPPKFLSRPLPIHFFSALKSSPREVEKIKAAIWEMLGLIRVYSKPQKQKADLEKPFTLPRGSTVMDFAVEVHKDFGEKLASARIWGSGKFPGQAVGRDHVLGDGDIVELHLTRSGHKI